MENDERSVGLVLDDYCPDPYDKRTYDAMGDEVFFAGREPQIQGVTLNGVQLTGDMADYLYMWGEDPKSLIRAVIGISPLPEPDHGSDPLPFPPETEEPGEDRICAELRPSQHDFLHKDVCQNYAEVRRFWLGKSRSFQRKTGRREPLKKRTIWRKLQAIAVREEDRYTVRDTVPAELISFCKEEHWQGLSSMGCMVSSMPHGLIYDRLQGVIFKSVSRHWWDSMPAPEMTFPSWFEPLPPPKLKILTWAKDEDGPWERVPNDYWPDGIVQYGFHHERPSEAEGLVLYDAKRFSKDPARPYDGDAPSILVYQALEKGQGLAELKMDKRFYGSRDCKRFYGRITRFLDDPRHLPGRDPSRAKRKKKYQYGGLPEGTLVVLDADWSWYDRVWQYHVGYFTLPPRTRRRPPKLKSRKAGRGLRRGPFRALPSPRGLGMIRAAHGGLREVQTDYSMGLGYHNEICRYEVYAAISRALGRALRSIGFY